MTNVIDSFNYGDTTYAFTLPYGSCSTAATTAAKAVTVSNFALETGARIAVKFTVTNTASSPTLNINNTGAKAIYYRGAAIAAGYLAANRTYEFIYNGIQWELLGDLDTNTTYSLNSFGVKATASELNVLDGVTATTAELNYVDGVTSNIQTQLNNKLSLSGGTVTGTITAPAFSGSLSGNAASATKLDTARTIGLGTGATGTATSFDGTSNITIPVTEVKESYLTWGGRNFASSYSPIDAAMIPELGANRLAYGRAAGITVEYSRDSGSTWTDYGLADSAKTALFSPRGGEVSIGKADSSNKATSAYMLRITIDTDTFGVYTALNKFAIHLSTNGSTGSYCTIEASLESAPTTFTTFANKITVAGWSGWNIINTSSFTTYKNTASSQYGLIRFTFGCTGGSTTYNGLQIYKIMGFGGQGWSTPSNLAKYGTIYSCDSSQNVTFPAEVAATTFKGVLSGNASTATKLATARTIRTNLASTSTASFDGSANITPGVTGTLPISNGGTGATTAADARTNLGAAASTDLANYLPLTGGTLSGALTVTSGEIKNTGGVFRCQLSTAGNAGLIATNSARSGMFYVSGGGNLGIYDNTNSEWIMYSNTSKNILFPGSGTVSFTGNITASGNANNIRWGLADNSSYVQLRQAGNSGSYTCSFVHYTSSGTTTFYNVFDKSGNFLLAPYYYLLAYDRGSRVQVSSEDNLIPLTASGDTYKGKANLGSTDNYWLSLYYSGSLSKQSDIRVKNVIGDLSQEDSLTILKGSHIKKFTYKTDDNNIIHFGVIAQEVRDLLIDSGIGYNSLLSIDDLATEKPITDLYASENGVRYAIDYTQYAPILIQGWQNHETRLEALERENIKLRAQLNALQLKLL